LGSVCYVDKPLDIRPEPKKADAPKKEESKADDKAAATLTVTTKAG
jgi:hypothetical protein